jgi:hypothetical protein
MFISVSKVAARLSALRAGRTLPPGFFIIFLDSWYSFLLEAESTPGSVRPEGLGLWRHSAAHTTFTLSRKRESDTS